jgi:hypothetical protein
MTLGEWIDANLAAFISLLVLAFIIIFFTFTYFYYRKPATSASIGLKPRLSFEGSNETMFIDDEKDSQMINPSINRPNLARGVSLKRYASCGGYPRGTHAFPVVPSLERPSKIAADNGKLDAEFQDMLASQKVTKDSVQKDDITVVVVKN